MFGPITQIRDAAESWMSASDGNGGNAVARAQVREMAGHAGAALAVHWAPNGRHALSAGKDGTLRLWNPMSGLLVRTFSCTAREARDCAAEPSGKRVAAASADKQLPIVDVHRGMTIRKLKGHAEGGSHCIRWRSGDSVLVSGGFDRCLRFWDARSWNADAIEDVTVASDAVLCATVPSYDATEVLAGAADGYIATVDIRKGIIVKDYAGGPVLSLSISGDRQCMLACVLDEHEQQGVMRLFDRRGGEPLASYRGFACNGAKVCSCFTWDDSHSVAGGEDGRICSWELVSAELAHELQAFSPGTTVTDLSQHPSSLNLLASGTDGSIRLLQ